MNIFRHINNTLLPILLIGFLWPSDIQARSVFVHLFEWKWTEIANECEQFLGPKGFEAVQISPPNEHIEYHTWWARYQPVSYQLNSRSGSQIELKNMIDRCNAVGVKIYVDLVINHTAAWNGGGVGSAGTHWSAENHPGLYSSNDYHSPRYDINNYSDSNHVWNGKLSGLPDLNTQSDYVQNSIANFIKTLSNMGVAGFRIDAAKHMSPTDIDQILLKANRPWVFLEVIGAGGESSEIQPNRYAHLGRVTEFKYSTDLAANFNGQIKNLRTLGPLWGLLPDESALVFVDNHDRERGHGGGGALTYKEGTKYNLANVFMLAFPYGYPKIMSGYEFTDTDAGPPSGPTNCDNSLWVCQHRWSNIANMVGFRNSTSDATEINNWWDNGNNQIAFSRGNKGFVVINNQADGLNKTLQTGLVAGNYCNILAGDNECNGDIISVDNSGNAHFDVGGMSAVAIHAGAMDDGGCGDCGGFNKIFSTLNFRGTPNNWNNSLMALVADNTWQTTIYFDGQENQRFKFDVNGDWTQNYGNNNSDIYLDQSGADIYTAVSGNYLVTVNDETLAFTLTPSDSGNFQSNFNSLFFRGTANDWAATAMSLVSNNIWELSVYFDGRNNQRFKVDVAGDWSQNYGSNNGTGLLNQSGNDITTTVSGNYLIRIDDEALTYQIIAQ